MDNEKFFKQLEENIEKLNKDWNEAMRYYNLYCNKMAVVYERFRKLRKEIKERKL